MTREKILDCLEGFALPDWEMLPDFGLYMDQVLTFVSRTFACVGDRLDLTSSMINNYVKAGLIDKPDGKKYSRDALAQLLMIVQLKVSTPLDMMKELLHPENGPDTRELYELFRKYQKQVITEYRKTEEAPRLVYALTSSALQWILRLSGEEE